MFDKHHGPHGSPFAAGCLNKAITDKEITPKGSTPMGTSHLIMGILTDYLTGQTLPDTHDERILQKIARFLVDDKGYDKADIFARKTMPVAVSGKTGTITVHFTLQVNGVAFAVIMYGPGSIVTRQRPTLAVARLLDAHVIPYAMITNGTDANLMDTNTGKIIGKALSSMPSKSEALEQMKNLSLNPLPPDRREKESRILYAMDILTHAECSEYVCPLP